ncbi:MAG TPA: hypothetical protein VHY91_26255 [Pirellulales bacterium]|nr:hypothetical protein [Pirellulales bacterium]
MSIPRRVVRLLNPLLIASLIACAGLASGAETRVLFDIPDKIECRDVTPDKCAAAHPDLKVIEAKFRISASFIEGTEASIIDFAYIVASPEMRLKIQDYLPNTTLESTAADDSIEVADTTESTGGMTEEAKVAYKILSLGATKSQTEKKTQSGHYKQIVSKALVLASGTINREHGVFFKLRPSKGASLEGAKEFTFLAIVPKTWRGDWCTIACLARMTKKSPFSTTTVLAGIDQAHVGLYLSGDREAGELADQLWQVQEANNGILSLEMAKEAAQRFETMHAATASNHSFLHHDELLHFLRNKFESKETDQTLEAAKAVILDLQDRLGKLSGG